MSESTGLQVKKLVKKLYEYNIQQAEF
jgi:hypothetical protein